MIQMIIMMAAIGPKAKKKAFIPEDFLITIFVDATNNRRLMAFDNENT